MPLWEWQLIVWKPLAPTMFTFIIQLVSCFTAFKPSSCLNKKENSIYSQSAREGGRLNLQLDSLFKWVPLTLFAYNYQLKSCRAYWIITIKGNISCVISISWCVKMSRCLRGTRKKRTFEFCLISFIKLNWWYMDSYIRVRHTAQKDTISPKSLLSINDQLNPILIIINLPIFPSISLRFYHSPTY